MLDDGYSIFVINWSGYQIVGNNVGVKCKSLSSQSAGILNMLTVPMHHGSGEVSLWYPICKCYTNGSSANANREETKTYVNIEMCNA